MAAYNRIDVHHHIVPQEYVTALQGIGIHNAGGMPFPAWSPEIALGFMERHGIATAITSISSPGVHVGDAALARSLARRCNEVSARLISDHPQRFGAFAVVPLPDVEGALAEVEYALDTLKLDGVVLLSNVGEQYLGDPAFDPLFDELHRRRAVVFIHPNASPGAVALKLPMPQFVLEFVFNTTRALGNLIFSGTLERCPDIRFIVAHAGGAAPYLAWRMTIGKHAPSFVATDAKAPKGAIQYLKNLYYDVALSSSPYALRSLQELADPSHILFGSDFPFAPEVLGAEAMQGLEAYEGFDAAYRHSVNRTNALELFPRLRTTETG